MIGAMDSEHAAPFIDPRTIVFFSGIMGGLMAVVLAFLRRSEKFVVLLPETPMDVAHVVAERIRSKVAEMAGPSAKVSTRC